MVKSAFPKLLLAHSEHWGNQRRFRASLSQPTRLRASGTATYSVGEGSARTALEEEGERGGGEEGGGEEKGASELILEHSRGELPANRLGQPRFHQGERSEYHPLSSSGGPISARHVGQVAWL